MCYPEALETPATEMGLVCISCISTGDGMIKSCQSPRMEFEFHDCWTYTRLLPLEVRVLE